MTQTGNEVNVVVQENKESELTKELNTFLQSVDEESQDHRIIGIEQQISSAGITFAVSKKRTGTVESIDRYFIFKSSESGEIFFLGKENIDTQSFNPMVNVLTAEKETN
mgnify:CR=1 FL=1